MALVLTNLTQWVNDNAQDLFVKAILQAETIPYMTVMPNCKYKTRIKYLASEAPFTAGGCGFTASGSTTLTEKDITVVQLKTAEEICPEDLNEYSLQLSLKPGYNTSVPFESLWVSTKIALVQKGIEKMIWANAAASTTAFEGYKHMMDADATVNDHSFSWCATGKTSSDYMTAIFEMQNKLPAEIQSFEDLTLFVGHEVFRKIVQSLVIANLYHVDLTQNNGLTPFVFPGTNIKIVPVNGLNDLCYTVLTPSSNLIYGTDVDGEENKVKVWWSEDNQIVRMVVNFKSGVSYYFSEYVVLSQA